MNNIFKHIKGDFFGGLTAGIVALPLALAFGVSSGLGASAGLYGALFLSFFAALFGGTNTQISGPTAPMTALSMVIISTIVIMNDGDVSKALPLILGVFLLSGLLQIAQGLLGLGIYIKYIPYPVVSGFMTAIGLIILTTQALPVLGYYPKEDLELVKSFEKEAENAILVKSLEENSNNDLIDKESFTQAAMKSETILEIDIQNESKVQASKHASGVIGALRVLPRAIQNIDLIELLLALGTIVIIYGFKRITTVIPSTLVGLILMTIVAIFFTPGYRPITEIPGGFPMPQWGIFTEISVVELIPYFFTALTLSLLGTIDSLLTSVVADNLTKTRHKPNKELIGQGIGNIISSIFGGLPGAGATIRTVVNINSGGVTRISGMISSMVLLFIILIFSSIASKIPAAVLAGILVTVGISVMDYKGLKAISILPKDIKFKGIGISSEVIIMLSVMLLATFWNLVYAVGIGLLIACIFFMKKSGDSMSELSLVRFTSKEKLNDKIELLDVDGDGIPDIAVKQIVGPLFFGSSDSFQKMISSIPDSSTIIVFKLDSMNYIDQSGIYIFEEIITSLTDSNKQIYYTGLQNQPKLMLQQMGLFDSKINDDKVYIDYTKCINEIKKNF
jgi:SulP family sulfate permease